VPHADAASAARATHQDMTLVAEDQVRMALRVLNVAPDVVQAVCREGAAIIESCLSLGEIHTELCLRRVIGFSFDADAEYIGRYAVVVALATCFRLAVFRIVSVPVEAPPMLGSIVLALCWPSEDETPAPSCRLALPVSPAVIQLARLAAGQAEHLVGCTVPCPLTAVTSTLSYPYCQYLLPPEV
jgi:hypothetical protein